MKNKIIISGLLALLLLNVFSSCEKDELKVIEYPINTFNPVPVTKTHDQTVFMHYVPWFETKESNSGTWGPHWTMANQNPDIIDANGNRQIASHFYPLIGPYHSGDKSVIEYHLLLMKYAGIDGVLIDWYGSFDVNDYKINLENSNALIEMIAKVGLKFAIVYEDRTLEPVVNSGLAGSVESAARIDMQYMQNNYFNLPTYYRIDGKPLLLVFGPDRLKSEQEWTNVFSSLNPKPVFLPLAELSSTVGNAKSGEFAWIFDGEQSKEDTWYQNIGNLEIPMGSAYPGFHDFYKEGGYGDSFFFIDHNNGVTLDNKLQQVKNANLDLVQLVTWNDYGEGTVLEPTQEFGFSFLEKIRNFNEVNSGSNQIFQNIFDLYTKRVENPNDLKFQSQLDQAFYYFVSMQTDKAIEELYK
ncbi:glycoside hydrolase family 71/99-like protein [Polaribacter sp.]|uniref:glycoside hydrolase family 71/99-like protein n=1 Tax=Polaribacter sp. TaxID=1920175 RepID=UPI004047A082